MNSGAGAVAGLLLGAGVGVLAGYLAWGDVESKPVFVEQKQRTDKAETQLGEALAELAAARFSVTASNAQLAAASAEAKRKSDEAGRLAAELDTVKAVADAKVAELATEKLKAASLQSDVERIGTELAKFTNPAPPLDAVRTRGRELADKVAAALANKDGKDAILPAMRELGALGKGAYREFFEAFAQVIAIGNPFMGKNDLKLTMPEFVGLMPAEMRGLALTESDVPAGAKIFSMYSLPWDTTLTSPQKVEKLGMILDGTREKTVATAAIENLGQMGTKEAVPYLSRAASNAGLDAEARARAISNMARYGDDADWPTIEQLANDPDPKVKRAAQAASYKRKPPASGVLVIGFRTEMNMVESGIQVGDIIEKYNGTVVADEGQLWAAIAAETERGTQSVVIDVFRDGKTERLTAKPGDLGVSGVEVKKQ